MRCPRRWVSRHSASKTRVNALMERSTQPTRSLIRMQKADNLDIVAKLVLAVGAGAAIYLIGVPLAMLLFAAFRGPADFLPFEPGARWTLEHIHALFTDPVIYTRVLPDTLVFVAGAVALVFVIAFTLAWLVERTDLPGRELWFSFILFPLLVPTPVLAIAWIFLMGPNAGWLNLLLRGALGLDGSGPINIFSMGGLILCQALASTPFVFLLLTATLRAMDPALEEASGTSGASPLTTFRRVTLPVLLPGLLAPLVLITLITAEQFELPLIIGLPARINVFSYRIYFELNPLSSLPNYGGAAALSLAFVVLGVLLLLLYNRLIKRADRFVTVTGKGYRQRRLPLGNWKVPALAFVGLYMALAAVLPAAVLVWTSLFGYALPVSASAADFTLEAYQQLFANRAFWIGLRNTLLVALVSALVVTLIGTLLGWIISRSRLRIRHALDFISVLSVGIPAVIAGLGVMLLYLSLPLGLYGTVWILVVAYSYRFATTTRLARAGFLQIHKELEEASATAGARWLATQRRVMLPLMLPALSAGFTLLFIVGVREFTIPLVLYSQDNVVLSVLLWQLFQSGQATASAALASIIIVVVLPVILVARRYLARGAPAE
jgi:iron(III) transport system permease protein